MPKYISKLITESGHRKFSKRETSVFKMLLEEYKSSEIAALLGLDEKTISTYKLRLLQKTGSKTIIGLYLFNVKHKIVSLDKTA
jgi:DNA-binding CsgD family transcriptional regulator